MLSRDLLSLVFKTYEGATFSAICFLTPVYCKVRAQEFCELL